MSPDDPEMDATDAAHPAFWRGNDSAVFSCAEIIRQLCASGERDSGTAREPWESARQAVIALRRERDGLRETLDATECSHEDEEAAHADTLRLLAIEQEKSQAVARECGRLSAALAVFADPDNWGLWDVHIVDRCGYLWMLTKEPRNPIDFARRALEGKP